MRESGETRVHFVRVGGSESGGYHLWLPFRQIKLRLRDRSLSTKVRLRRLETMRQVSRPHSLMLKPELSKERFSAMSRGYGIVYRENTK